MMLASKAADRLADSLPPGRGGIARITRRCAVAMIASLFVPATALAADKRPMVASFSILGDFVRNVGGDRVSVTTIVGPDGDAHVYQPSAADGRKIAQAELIFVNGLGFEGWIERLIASAKGDHATIVASKGVAVHQNNDGLDPHAWQNVANAKIYVANIRDALVAADPAGAALYKANASAYLAKLDALDAEVDKTFAAIPKQRRRIISTHDAFGYFGARYGISFIAPQGVSTDSEPSARDVARIIDAVRREKVGAVFLENIADPRLAQRIAAETGARMGGVLYSDALTSEKEDGANYIDMVRHNVRELAKALTP